MSTNIVPVFYACDGAFVKYTVVSMHSMIQNASKDATYHIHILHTEIPEDIKEIILALPATIEGDTTNYYLSRVLKEFKGTISTIAKGISVGDALEYADEVTLGRSIANRIPYNNV